MIRQTSFVLLGALLACVASARDEYTRIFDKTLPLQAGQHVFIESKFGDIIVRTHLQPDVVIHALIRVSAASADEAKSYADRVDILVEPSSSELSIRTRYPETSGGLFNFRNTSYSIHYEITLPEAAPLEVRNSFGGISVAGIKAGATLTNSHGDLELRDSRGVERLANSFGSVHVSNNSGDVSIDNTNGSIEAADIGGALTIHDRFASITAARISKGITIANNNGSVEVSDCGAGSIKNSFGSVSVQNVHGDITVNNQNGAIDANHVQGAAELNTSFARVSFSDIGSQLSVHANNSRVEGEKVGGPVAIRNSFGLVRADGINGPLSVRNQNGAVNASHTRGAQVSTSFAPVILEAIDGPIQIDNQNGSVDASSADHGACQPIIIHTSFSPIRVHLAANPSYSVFAKTSFAKIRTDFPLMVSDVVSSDDLTGKIGSGACELRLTNNNAPIEILKSGP